MKELSQEIIEIDGTEYTLFLNRKGLIAWEKFTKEEGKKLDKLKEAKSNYDKVVEISDETDPFATISDEFVEELVEGNETASKLYEKLYWILLYTNHKLSISEVKNLYKIATKEYGQEALIELGTQMIEDVVKDLDSSDNSNNELKKLTALRPKKK